MSSSAALSCCHTIKPTSVKFYKLLVLDNLTLFTLCFYLTISKATDKSICHFIAVSWEKIQALFAVILPFSLRLPKLQLHKETTANPRVIQPNTVKTAGGLKNKNFTLSKQQYENQKFNLPLRMLDRTGKGLNEIEIQHEQT